MSELKQALRDASGQQVGELRYETHMWGGLQTVEEQAKKGGQQVVALLKELSARVQLQRDMGAGMKKLGDELSEHHHKLLDPSRKRGANFEVEAEHLDKTVVAPLRKWQSEGSKELEQLFKKASELKDRLAAHVKSIETARGQSHAAADAAEQALREYEYAQKNLLLEAKERTRIEAAHRERGPAAIAAEKKYVQAVEEGNKAREQHIQFTHMLLAAHESLEVNRLRAVNVAATALWEVDAGVAAPVADPKKTVQIWIAEHQTNLSPPPPFVVVPYEPHHPAIPYEAPDPGSLPTGPKQAEVTRKQVMPKMLPVKRFMKLVHAAVATQVFAAEGEDCELWCWLLLLLCADCLGIAQVVRQRALAAASFPPGPKRGRATAWRWWERATCRCTRGRCTGGSRERRAAALSLLTCTKMTRPAW